MCICMSINKLLIVNKRIMNDADTHIPIANDIQAEISVSIYCIQKFQTLKERRGIQVSNLCKNFSK